MRGLETGVKRRFCQVTARQLLGRKALEKEANGLVGARGGNAGEAESVVELRVVGTQGEGASKRAAGLVGAAEPAEGEANVVLGVTVVGGEACGVLEGTQGSANGAGVEEETAELTVETGRVRETCEGAAADLQSRRGRAEKIVDGREAGMSTGILWIKLDQGAITESGFLEARGAHGRCRAAAPEADVSWVQTAGSAVETEREPRHPSAH